MARYSELSVKVIPQQASCVFKGGFIVLITRPRFPDALIIFYPSTFMKSHTRLRLR